MGSLGLRSGGHRRGGGVGAGRPADTEILDNLFGGSVGLGEGEQVQGNGLQFPTHLLGLREGGKVLVLEGAGLLQLLVLLHQPDHANRVFTGQESEDQKTGPERMAARGFGLGSFVFSAHGVVLAAGSAGLAAGSAFTLIWWRASSSRKAGSLAEA